MFEKKRFLILSLVIFSTIFLTACGTTANIQQPQLESGVIDQDYQGILNPEPPKEIKLSEKEKRDGIEKITIKCGVQIDVPGQQQTEPPQADDSHNQNSGGDSIAKPKI